MNATKKEFLEFITHGEKLPRGLDLLTKKDIQLSFHKKSILTKFILFQILGASFTLTVCPQFGIGLPEGHGIAHYFRILGDWACAAFCGSLFLSAGMVVSYLGMKGEELWWVWRRYKISLILMPAMMWSTLMLMNMNFVDAHETIIYHSTWLISAILSLAFWLAVRSKVYHSYTLQKESVT